MVSGNTRDKLIEEVNYLREEVSQLRNILWTLTRNSYRPSGNQVKEFRDLVGCGLAEARSLLTHTYGDVERAREYYKLRGS
jgi:hypothetical protein